MRDRDAPVAARTNVSRCIDGLAGSSNSSSAARLEYISFAIAALLTPVADLSCSTRLHVES